jgi:hypothetical protein
LQPGKFSSPPRVRVRRSHMRPRREVARRWARQRGEAPARSRAWDLQRRPHRQSVHGLDFPVLWFFKTLQPGKFSSPLRRPHSPVPCPTGPRGRSAPPLGSNGEARRLEAVTAAEFCVRVSRRLDCLRKRRESAVALLHQMLGSGVFGPYHFQARIQSFQALVAPFAGESARRAAPQSLEDLLGRFGDGTHREGSCAALG